MRHTGHEGNRFEHRPLARPDEELVDQGLAFDLETMFSRRRMLAFLGLGVVGIGVAACGGGDDSSSTPTSGATGSSTAGSSATSSASSTTTASSSSTTGSAAGTATTEIPDETAGPYPGDGSNGPDVLAQSGVIRSDIRSSFGDASGVAEGVPVTLELTITDLANGGVPFADAAVYVWHCTRDGEYSMYGDAVADENFLRGVQIADADGTVRFTTIFPGCYAGRWPHIHFEVYPDASSIGDANHAIATSQVALPADSCATVYAESGYEASVRNLSQVTLESDNVFSDDAGAAQLATVAGSIGAGLVVSLPVGVDTTTTPTGGALAGPAGGRPGS